MAARVGNLSIKDAEFETSTGMAPFDNNEITNIIFVNSIFRTTDVSFILDKDCSPSAPFLCSHG